jgi:hypothetical protein
MINGIGSVGGLIFNFPGLLFSGGKGFAAGFAKGSGVADFRELVRGMRKGKIEICNLLYYPRMLRLFLLFFCAVFWACSSDDESSLNNWFSDQGIAASYKREFVEVDISVESVYAGFDSSISMVSQSAVLGTVNNLKHTLYFGLQMNDSPRSEWKLRIDATFYSDFNKEPPDEIPAKIYWLKEAETEPDSIWLKLGKSWEDSTDIVLKIADNIIEAALPDEILNAQKSKNLLVGLELIPEGEVLRIVPPNVNDVDSLLRVAQKTVVLKDEQLYLYSGVDDSLLISFAIDEEANKKIRQGKTVVFAQIVLPKQNDNSEESELGYPLPVYVYSKIDTLQFLEDYRVDTAYVENHGHPNLLFWPEVDSLTLQVTKNARRYIKAADNTLSFVLRFGNPMLNTKSHYFYNLSNDKVFASHPAYARYDFNYLLGKKAKLKLWFADYGEDKK